VLSFAQDKALDEIIESILVARVKREPEKTEVVFELAAHYRSRRNDDAMVKVLDRFINESSERRDETAAHRRTSLPFPRLDRMLTRRSSPPAVRQSSPTAGREEWLRLADFLAEQGETEEAIEAAGTSLEPRARRRTSASDVDERLLSLLIGDNEEAGGRRAAEEVGGVPTAHDLLRQSALPATRTMMRRRRRRRRKL